MSTANSVLARKLGLTPAQTPAEPAPVAPSAMRLMRRALGRAADKAVSLPAVVMGIAEDEMLAEEMIDGGPDGWIVLGLRNGAKPGLTGLFLLDPPLRSALIEMQTMGSLLPASEDERRVTRTDAVMAMPFADQLLKELAEVNFCSDELDPAGYDMGPLDDLRTAGLVLTPGTYRIWRITVQLGAGDRQGEMMIAMRPEVEAPAAPTSGKPLWSAALRDALGEAPADLDAILTRVAMPISKIEELEIGQLLHLPGTTVGSVTLAGPDGKTVASARLGQIAGKRAVRVELSTLELQDDVPRVGPGLETGTGIGQGAAQSGGGQGRSGLGHLPDDASMDSSSKDTGAAIENAAGDFATNTPANAVPDSLPDDVPALEQGAPTNLDKSKS